MLFRKRRNSQYRKNIYLCKELIEQVQWLLPSSGELNQHGKLGKGLRTCARIAIADHTEMKHFSRQKKKERKESKKE